ncbi:polyprenyl diphosphate synthase [Gleimia sp. 6138-11-ORH1]|uniref:polyprenyl diphosphate synthase n=1 Tax=Gleimia sp. 6138-11-ORH1 TaxID=2973937 RepID=UPI00216A8C59|nr:polyprenyl diphosphate synthase [Gleimia sp. 6138-11-ORH1]MCS4484197.1 polyprenyl diphosphate synthase [Gleimia sp. 6138-11-ORH1]
MTGLILPPGAGELKAPQISGVPKHVAIIMDGNGRWANERGLPRTEGHRQGEIALMDTIAGAVEIGVKELTVYAFSTENWKRSPAEVKFLMGYSRDVIRRRAAQLHSWGVRINWWGRRPRLWKSVITELEKAHQLTRENTRLDFNMAVNYGGRAEITDAVNQITREVAAGSLQAGHITEGVFGKRLYGKGTDVDLLIRTGGEQRISNFLLWQCAYAEFMFNPVAWPEYRRETLWDDILAFTGRERRFGTAQDKVTG